MVIDSRRILGGFAVFALVLMRLVIGWHFFGEGTEKVEYDRQEKRFRLVFSADKEFLDVAKGPLAFLYVAHSLSGHEWRSHLASPRENVRPTAEQAAEQAKWAKEYAQRRADARKNSQPVPAEFPPHTASQKWAAKIAEDWRTAVNRFSAIAGVTDAQKQAAEQALAHRLDELAEYIRGEEPNIAEYRHELWRLANWRQAPEAGDVPFQKQRIAVKAGETTAAAAGWKGQVAQIEHSLHDELHALLTAEQRVETATTTAIDHALADPNQHKLAFINKLATAVTIGVGACLILGFFTRLAAIIGALFLLGVIVSQPFWISGAAPTINQCVEFTALLVLAGTGAGRWAGMDGCLAALFRRRRALVVQET